MNNSTNQTSQNMLNNIDFLQGLNIIFRFVFLITNAAYFIVLIFCKRIQKLTYFQTHHVNFLGLVQSVLLASWSFGNYPSFSNQVLNEMLCFMSEILWAILKHVRAYTIMVLAIYRILAVFWPKLYKRISRSLMCSILTGSFSWIVPILSFFIMKYSLGTINGFICSDGYSNYLESVLIYFGVTYFIGNFIPMLLVIIFYVMIQLKLNKSKRKLLLNNRSTQEAIETNSPYNPTVKNTKRRDMIKKENSLAFQLWLLNSLEIISFICIIFLSFPLQYSFNNFNPMNLLNILGSLNCVILSLIPFVTLYYLFRID